MSDLFDLTGKTAILTGASKGMGFQMAQGLAKQGAKVVISSRTQADLDAAADAINKACGAKRAYGVAANAGYKDQLDELVAKSRELAGKASIVVGNAGVNPYYGVTSEIPDKAYEKTMQVNVQSNLWLAQLTAPDMAELGGGSMLYTSSIGAFKPSIMLGTYAMSKLAVIGLVRNLAAEFGPKGIRVNALCPGVVKTEFARELWDNPKAAEHAQREIPLRRFGEPEDFEGIAVFLGSRAGQYITGQALTVDGGSVMWT